MKVYSFTLIPVYFERYFSVVAMQLDQGRNIASAVAEFVKGDTFEVVFLSYPTLTNCRLANDT